MLQAKTGSATTQYLYSLGTRSLAQNGGAWEYLLPDALGSVRQIVDANGNVTLAKSYEPREAGTVLTSTGTASSIFAYAGEQIDTTGLIYLRARYLNPRLGLFLARDPWSGDVLRPGSMNGFGYGLGNPVNRVDPTGMCSLTYRGNAASIYNPYTGGMEVNSATKYQYCWWLLKRLKEDYSVDLYENNLTVDYPAFLLEEMYGTRSGLSQSQIYGMFYHSEAYSIWNNGLIGPCTGCHIEKDLNHVPNDYEILASIELMRERLRQGTTVGAIAAIIAYFTCRTLSGAPPEVGPAGYSPELEAGLQVLRDTEPEYAALIDEGIFPLKEIPSAIQAGASHHPSGVVLISPDPAYPGSTAAVLVEELKHAFQGRMPQLAAEIEAQSFAAEYVKAHSISVNPLDEAIIAYLEGDMVSFVALVKGRIFGGADTPIGPGFLHGQ